VTAELPGLRPFPTHATTDVTSAEPASLSTRAVHLCVVLGIVVGVPALGWQLGGVVAAAVLSIVAGLLWSTFRGPGDGGTGRILVPGPVRLCIELDVVAAAAAGLAMTWGARLAVPFSVLALTHGAATTRRIVGLLATERRTLR
jgi:Protein of unknown function (DUF2568)